MSSHFERSRDRKLNRNIQDIDFWYQRKRLGYTQDTLEELNSQTVQYSAPQKQAPVVAFGQTIAYRLFSTKTYIAMPTTLTEEDQSRLESLCMLFGVGLVLFDLNKDAPQFSIRVRAQRFSPDMFYVNEFADRLKHHDVEVFEELLG